MPNAMPSLDTIFSEAVELPGGAQRAAYLDRACGGAGDAFRRRVEALIDAHFRAGGSFLEHPVAGPDSTAAFAHAPDDAPASDPGTAIGPYTLRELLGEGGMGVVFVAEQTHPVRRKVALKLIKPGMDSRQVVARFEAERQALALMDHPNIAKVLDAGSTTEGRPYFVMELVKGEPVTDYCDRHRLDLRRRLGVFLQVCQAVQHAHQKGVIHRDLKPSNVLIAVHDVAPVAKVIDFGIAKAVGQSLTDKTVYTAVAQFVGTPLYMSPEQAGQSGLDVDTRTDVYALGVLMYELLTGTTPIDPAAFRRAGPDEVRRIIREDEPPRPSARVSTLAAAALSTVADRRTADPRRLARQVRGELDWVVMKCLEKDRNRRYESASALAADVQHYLADEPVAACPPSPAYRLRKFARRNRGRVSAAAAVLGLAVLTAAAGGWLYLERAGERERTAGGVRESLAGVRAGIEAGDLGLAERRAAEARGRLGPDPGRLGELDAEVDRAGGEIDARRADADRFRQFLALAEEGQDKMGYSWDQARTGPAEESLGLFGVLTDDGWPARLDGAYLTTAQKARVREAAYVTLVSLADFQVRWLGTVNDRDPQAHARRGLDLLTKAEAFHEPTRAFHFVRAECRKRLGDDIGAEADRTAARAAPARTAWDHYLPAHTAGWQGDLGEAIRGYEAALRVQPDHYNSLFFLAARLGTDKVNRRAEATQLLRGCIALRPTHIYVYITRAEFLEKLGRRDEAAADLTAAVDRAATDEDRVWAYQKRAEFSERVGAPGKAREDRAKAADWSLRLAEERTARLGPDHPDALTALHALIDAYYKAGRPADAVPHAERLVERRRAVLGPDHPATLLAATDLAVLYAGVGRRPDGVRLLEPAVEHALAKLGPDHKTTLLATYNLGVAYAQVGRREDGVRLLELVVGRTRAALGPDNSLTLDAMTSLAREYERAGRTADELRVLEPLMECTRAARGPDHPDTLLVTNNLGVAYTRSGRFDDAIRILEPLPEKIKSISGADHPDAMTVMTNLADLYNQMSRFKDSVRVLEPLVERSRAVRGPDHLETLRLTGFLATAYQELGRNGPAESLLRDTVERLRRVAGPRVPDTAGALSLLGLNLLKHERYADAEPVLRECLGIREEKLRDHWLRFNTMSMLGGALFGQKRYAEAEPLLLEGYEGLKARAAAIPGAGQKRPLEAVERLVSLYEATGHPEKAAEWRAKLPRPVAPPPRLKQSP